MESTNTAKYADLFAALGSEPRLEIMRLLFAAYPQGMIVGDIQAKLQIPNSTLSHHLEKLRQEHLISSRKEKQYIWYSVNTKTTEDLLAFLFNGCAIGNPRTKDKLDPVQNPFTEAGFMFEGFLRSIESLFGNVFDRMVLPRGFERFSQKATQVIALAQEESRRLGHQYVGTEQLLLGLIGEGTGTAAQILSAEGLNLENMRVEVEKRIGHGKGTPLDIPFTPRAKRVLELSVEQSQRLGNQYIGTEHLLLGIVRERGGMAVRVLEHLGVNLYSLEQRILQLNKSD
ncbi:metalloregulator ArsR/SmtB family transcription factor [Gloeocapsopsis crepidinum LEGE 06123]|uniref:Metalloregulator ArsR/SmtB family transcription factor n=1 Tax=Gloeocapsopsis crepidinum LEGE 06123 TaxID=588587 RepID=A0ABR9UV83_9CHRO|nr:metalloregulator ArsR/SmtB family transcription factor [Gloeocapsopsis crepidinum LEGE 06123]